MNFYKSLAVAGGVTGTILGAVLLTGLMTDQKLALENKEFKRPQTLRIQAIPIRLGGYSLKYKRGAGDIVMLSVSVTVPGRAERDLVCRLAPRLVSTVTNDVTIRYSDVDELRTDLTRALPEHLRRRFNLALNGNLIQSVTVDKVEAGKLPPQSTCTDAP
ncbi:hypothetical protein RJ527_11135 [Thalassospiraceae bacterium LMO-SO8]|nr:hypothetical protein [Alphaproteobacteria bacterium LMO-S08]WND74593.1 hypothetical protein RJ527_11135 [Thalassospiraceae bacterium LMO-SO8]